jgi:hypothetical protein
MESKEQNERSYWNFLARPAKRAARLKNVGIFVLYLNSMSIVGAERASF